MLKTLLSPFRAVFKKSDAAQAMRPMGEEELYRAYDFLDAYSRHTDQRVDSDPKSPIGGRWEEIGALQFDFLIGKGLQPHHKLLDIGCGTLRGGRHFIRHLDAGNYTGIDISRKAIEAANRLVQDEGLAEQAPRLLVNEKKNLKFHEFDGATFDFLLAQSVFTHLLPEHIEECFENVGKIMGRDSYFYCTFNRAADYQQTGLKDFEYPSSFFAELAGKHSFVLEDCSADFPHPRQQCMVRLARKKPQKGAEVAKGDGLPAPCGRGNWLEA